MIAMLAINSIDATKQNYTECDLPVTQDVRYKNINSIVRTGRCAILINDGSSHWRAAAQQIVTAASEVWGGRSFIIIPTDGNRISAKFWQLLEAYSPDHICVYHLTVADLETSSPMEYEQIRERYRAQWEASGYDDSNFEDWFRRSAETSTFDPLSIADSLNRQLLERLSPFSLTGTNSIGQYISRRSGFGFPFTDMAKILPFSTESVRTVTMPQMPDNVDARLILASQSGLVSPSYQNRLDSVQVAVNPPSPNVDIIDTIAQLLGSRPISGNALDQGARTPFNLSMLHLGEYYDARRHNSFREPVVVVLGDDVQDFCFYYSLSRLHRGICWLPLAWLRDTSSYLRRNSVVYAAGSPTEALSWQQRLTIRLVDLFFELIEHGTGEKIIQLCSTSLTLRQLYAYRRQLIECCVMAQPQEFAAKIACVSLDHIDVECTMSVFEEDNYTNNASITFADGTSVSPLPTPKPKNFTTVLPSGHYWITSLQIEGYVPPTVPSLSQKILGTSGLALDSRVGRDGVAYHCPSMSYFGGGIEANLVRPRVTMPDEMSLLSSYFELAGVKIAYSDKGNYVLDAIARFGDLDKVGTFVKNPATRAILDMFVAGAPTGDGRAIYLTNDQRTYLRFDAFAVSIADEVDAADLVDSLVERQIIERGYILLCHRCRLSSWYPIGVITREFTCGRCGLRQPFSRSRWKMPVEASWYYKLAETIYQFYLNHSDVTVQTLHKLKSMARSSFLYAPEIELQQFPVAGKKRELDVACILDGRIIVGECKTEVLKRRDVEKFDLMQRNFYKPPAAVVFATNLATVSDDFRARADSIEDSMIWTFDDLYD